MKTLLSAISGSEAPRRRFLGGLAAVCFAFMACALMGQPAAPAPKPLRVLFIGNSLTYVNLLPEMLRQFTLARNEERPLECQMAAFAGATLSDHWDVETNGARQAIANGHWDYVVLQDHSMSPVTNFSSMRRYSKKFNALIRKAGAQTVFYETWARKDRPKEEEIKDRERIHHAYASLAKDLNAVYCPVGDAWTASLTEHPELTLHAVDGLHPLPTGTYLAACVFYQVLYNKSPEGLPRSISETAANGKPVNLATLSEKDAAILQKIAEKTVTDWKARP